MKNRKIGIIVCLLFITLTSCGQGSLKGNNHLSNEIEEDMSHEINKTEEEWKKELTPEEYHILREKGTERAFTGEYYDHKEKGVYCCAACGAPLFSSGAKYESGTGWPSFYEPMDSGLVATKLDKSYGMIRTEALCDRCGGHLGHIFDDGPAPTGQRYCINSASLDFKKKE